MPVNKIRDDLDVFVDAFRASNVADRDRFAKRADVSVPFLAYMCVAASGKTERTRLLARVNLRLCRDGFGPRYAKGVD